MAHSILEKIKMLKGEDILAILKFIIALICYPFFIKKRKNIWLICEDRAEARDNGYWLFKYICEKRKGIEVVYAIDYESPDYGKVCNLGKTCRYGTIDHWLYYLCGKYNISSQKGGKPNAALCYVLEVYEIIKNKSIFLQHGITLNNGQWLHYENTKMRLFICGAASEYEFIKNNFGYPEENLRLLGFSRFDQLHDLDIDKKMILIMPTWREWLNHKTDAYYKLQYDGVFEHSSYYKHWNALLNDKKFIEFIEKNNYKVLFFPHRNAQQYLTSFRSESSNICMASWKEYDIQYLLKKSALLITDYSSVAIDFSYMNKPVIYYSFDIEDFRLGQYEKGYFNYENNPLGHAAKTNKEIVELCEMLAEKDFELNCEQEQQIERFFGYRDGENCQRIVKAIEEI